ncbi:phage/plasmid primase, P4 family [Ligilactobacillus ceti]|uniref:Phage DNA polymerase n=1 Tax=Ligilactobacillus ceti DSM 22408 TaxID=1122146 RepID=A0A0R2KHG4_9LACO|nr:phage/plasmid primase, P4 family [Ligilactobacillus ceti]KRN88715.1 phage DNA polymerase [Ligilactobacillus ceti DSM 22408]
MKLTIYKSDVVQNSKNCIYPYKEIVTNKEELKNVVAFDHVCGQFKNNYRAKDNYIGSDCDVFDVDNDHTEDESKWIYPEDYEFIFGNVAYAIVPSRNNMKEKNGKKARPRHHIYFPHKPFNSVKGCQEFKNKVYENFKFLDKNALDPARFIYGNNADEIIWNDSDKSIEDVLVEEQDLFAEFDEMTGSIQAGSRNSTMSHIAGKLIKRYGITDTAKKEFLKQAEKCTPLLSDSELNKIWHSAIKFGNKVINQEGYIPPEQYNQEFNLMPHDLTDVGQAVMLSKEYKDILRHSSSTDYLVYNGSFWEESSSKAQGLIQLLTERQLEEAEVEIKKCMDEMTKNGAFELLAALGNKKALDQFSSVQRRSYDKYEKALVYQKFALKRRDSRYIWAALKEVKPMIVIEPNELDCNDILLNTPTNTINLKTGISDEHKASDFITKQTSVDPSNDGMNLWLDSLNVFFESNQELIDYVQKIVGLAVIGKVYVEALIIAYGEGRNGKSTFWNTIAKVLGTYSGTMSADILTAGCRRNAKPELAEAKGKRLLIAAELEEGMRMNTSNVKQLCSTDEITAEKKFKSPFAYTPSHTLVLYTNHLPRVGALDKGTWRRLIVIPFNAKIEGKSDIKNYTDYIFKNSGGAVLQWIIDGAKKVIKDDFKLKKPKIVEEAISKYQDENDWFNQFLEECCEIGVDFEEKSGELYSEYRSFCIRRGEYIRSTTDFYAAVESEGYIRRKTMKGNIIVGVRLKSEFENI